MALAPALSTTPRRPPLASPSAASLRRSSQRCAARADDNEQRRVLEDELRDPSSPLEYLVPRAVRRIGWFAAAGGSSLALALGCSHALSSPALAAADGSSQSLLVNGAVLAGAVAALLAEERAETARVTARASTRAAQEARGERVDSRLLQVDDAWIVKRLERMGAADNLPMLGPAKATALASIVAELQPRRVLEIGTFLGYSAIRMAQALPDDACSVTSIEKELRFVLSARRFLWQCNQGERSPGEPRIGRRVRVEWGDAAALLRRWADEGRTFDFCLIDGMPAETLQLALAAEPCLAPGATVVSHNALVFEKSLAPHIARVRAVDGPYSASRSIPAAFGWRGDVMDALEVSTWKG